MRRSIGVALLCAAALCAAAPGAVQAAPSEYGIASFGASQSTEQAGAHADLTLSFALKREAGSGLLPATTAEAIIDLPPGLAAYPGAVEQCDAAQLMATDVDDPSNATGCPQDAQVGIIEAQVFENGNLLTVNEPLYSMTPPASGEAVARFGFIGVTFPIVIDVALRSEGDYGAQVRAVGTSSFIPLLAVKSTTWGVPAAEIHDTQRITPYEAVRGGEPETSDGRRESGLSPKPFLSNPTRCGVPRPAKLTVSSYAEPDRQASEEAELPEISGCGRLDFGPGLSLAPTSPLAAEPTGLDSETTLTRDKTAAGYDTSALRAVKVVLPPEIKLAAGAGAGLEGCSEAEVGLGARAAAHCPEAAKIGVIEAETPVLERPLRGAVYQRTPTPGELLGLWLVIDEQGLHAKLRGRLRADRSSGQLTATFAEGTALSEGLPQAPLERISLRVFGGPRAPLAAPRRCGAYLATYEFTPWSGGKAVSGAAPLSFDEGCDTGGFSPRLSGAAGNPVAGAFSTLLTELSRETGEQEISSFELALPPGLAARLAGVERCEGAGAQSGDCPPGSRIGTVIAAAGPGPAPLWIPQPGKEIPALYLAPPYKGAPLSIIAKVPAQAGPFDLGDVVTRTALHLDPRTARVRAVTDPLPQLLEGVPTSLREVEVIVDRPGFALNPTDCSATRIEADVYSTEGAAAHAASPFGVAGCRALRFRPRLGLRLKGGVKRGAHPALRAVFRPRPGEANSARIQVKLPRSAFLDQAHIRTICTRVQFAAGAGFGSECPKGSIYGRVVATTPLLDDPLRGPVYLRSSNHNLPDLVAAVSGPPSLPIHFESAARIDSVKGGIRSTFSFFPDVPLAKAVLSMQGGRKGLIVNSRNLCYKPKRNRALAKLSGHNGRRFKARPVVRATGCAKAKRKAHKAHRRRAG